MQGPRVTIKDNRPEMTPIKHMDDTVPFAGKLVVYEGNYISDKEEFLVDGKHIAYVGREDDLDRLMAIDYMREELLEDKSKRDAKQYRIFSLLLRVPSGITPAYVHMELYNERLRRAQLSMRELNPEEEEEVRKAIRRREAFLL